MPARGLLTEDLAGGGDFEPLRDGFASFATRNWLRHKARKIVALRASDNCFCRGHFTDKTNFSARRRNQYSSRVCSLNRAFERYRRTGSETPPFYLAGVNLRPSRNSEQLRIGRGRQLAQHLGTAVNEAGVDLKQLCPGTEFLSRGFGIADAPNSDDRKRGA